jgi:hypothetical protein
VIDITSKMASNCPIRWEDYTKQDHNRHGAGCVLRQGKQMGTRSSIGIKSEDGTIKAIYCHWDGYLEGVGTGLVQNYNTKAKAEELINLGGFSSLHETLEETKAGAYGTESDKARTFTDEKDLLENFNAGEEFFYLYIEGEGWRYSQGENWACLNTESKVA